MATMLVRGTAVIVQFGVVSEIVAEPRRGANSVPAAGTERHEHKEVLVKHKKTLAPVFIKTASFFRYSVERYDRRPIAERSSLSRSSSRGCSVTHLPFGVPDSLRLVAGQSRFWRGSGMLPVSNQSYGC